MTKRIENEEQFDKAQLWLVKTAQELHDPLCALTPEQREKTMSIYDRTSALVQRYLRSQTMREFPEMKKVYDQLGWEYDIFDDEPKPKPKPEPRMEKKQETSALSDWLDD